MGSHFQLHKDKLDEQKHKAGEEGVISQVMGSQCRMLCGLLPKSSVKQPAPKPAMAPAPADSPPAAPPTRASGTPERVSEDEYRAAANDPLIREAVSRDGARGGDIR